MLRTAGRTILAVVVFALAASRIAAGGQIAWISDYEEAKRRALAENKLLLVNIHAEWCVPCKQLQAGTLSDPALAEEINQSCVPLSLDLDEHAAIVHQWSVTAYPTQLFLAPDGRVLHSVIGNVSVATYRAALVRALQNAGMSSATKERAPREAKDRSQASIASPADAKPDPVSTLPTLPPGNEAPPSGSQDVAAGLPPASPSLATNKDVRPCDMSVPLALNGFCPVRMIVDAELVPGDPKHCCVYRGKRYQFHSEEDKALFAIHPRKYLPLEEGFCVVTWAEEHRRSSGSIEYPALFGDYLFLFADEDARQKFLHNPERYVDAQGRAHRIPLHSFRGDRQNIR